HRRSACRVAVPAESAIAGLSTRLLQRQVGIPQSIWERACAGPPDPGTLEGWKDRRDIDPPVVGRDCHIVNLAAAYDLDFPVGRSALIVVEHFAVGSRDGEWNRQGLLRIGEIDEDQRNLLWVRWRRGSPALIGDCAGTEVGIGVEVEGVATA